MSGTLLHANTLDFDQPTGTRSAAWSVPETVSCVLLFAAAFGNLIDVAGNTEQNELSRQIMAKMLICGCCGIFGLYGVIAYRRVRQGLLSFPTITLFLIGILYLLSTLVSIEPLGSFASSLLYWMMFLFIVTAMHLLGSLRTLQVIGVGFFVFLLGSWAAYLMLPEVGVHQEFFAIDQSQARMGGLAHPNTLGSISAILAIIVLYFGIHQRVPWRFLAIPLALALGALVLSLSRTSMLAFVLSAVFVNRHILWKKNAFVLATVGAIMLLLGLFIVSLNGDLMSYGVASLTKLSKSGSLEELATGTGRLEIWGFAIEKIGDSMWLGHGLATAKIVMAEYSWHPHNFWLNMFFNGGVFCGALAIIMTVYLVWRALFRPDPAVDGIAIFILICGIAEPVVNEPVPGGHTMLLIVVTAWSMFAIHKRKRMNAVQSAAS